MNHSKYVFVQIASFLLRRTFDTIVSRNNGDYRVRHFTCWNQLLCMTYGQLSNRHSLSDLIITVNAHSPKTYHLGFGKGVSKANLGKSNANRDWRIFQDFAYHLIAEARKICMSNDTTQFSFTNPIYAFDFTTIDLCLSIFCWATFRRAKGAVKLHTQYDVRTSIPVFMHLTAGSVHDVQVMDQIVYETGSFYVFDKTYLNYERLFIIHESKSFFVIRAKANLRFKKQYAAAVDKRTGNRECCQDTDLYRSYYLYTSCHYSAADKNRVYTLLGIADSR